MILLVVLQLSPARRQSEAIHTLCEVCGDSCLRLQESVWLLDTLKEPRWWRDRLRERGDLRDRIFVTPLQPGWAALQLDGAAAWLTDPTRRW
jgi:hypothetical protein